MGFFSGLLSPVNNLLGGGGGGNSSSSFSSGGVANKSAETSNVNTTTNTDNRVVAAEGATVLGTGASSTSTIYDSSNRSIVYDNTVHDSSDRSISYTTTNADAAKITELNNHFLQALAEEQTDTVKALGQMGAESLRTAGEFLNAGYATAGSNQTKAWSATLDASSALLEKIVAQAGATTDASKAIAQSAVSAFTPTENKNADAYKWAAMAAAAVVALMVVPKLLKA